MGGILPTLGRNGSSYAFISYVLMRRGLSPQKLVSLAIEKVYKNLATSGYDTFEHFHSSVLSIFEIANSALPGRHFEAPSRRKVKEAFEDWKTSPDKKKKEEIFTNLLGSTELGKIDTLTLTVGLATPPFSIVAKRAGENVPPLKMIKHVPDALFVPSVTVLTLFTVKLIRKAMEKHREETEAYREEEEEEKRRKEEKKQKEGRTEAPS